MWRDYSSGYIRNNKAAGLSIVTAAMISALLLSLLCSLFYNLWFYEVEQVRAEEGSWQGRLTAELDSDDLTLIQNFPNVEKAVINEDLSEGSETAVDIYLKNIRTILTDMPQIAELTGLPPEAVTYNHLLLNLYLIRDPADPAPRLLFPFFLAVTVMACLSLIMIIHNAFAVSMNARIHQFGILSSIGATPRQIRTCLLQEAAVLCALPILAGALLGILISMGVVQGINILLADVEERLALPFVYHPAILLCSLMAAALTIWFSAWIPARKISRLTPMEAIRNTGEFCPKKKASSPILSFFFGLEGELAGNALKSQRKALRTSAYSLTVSFLAFSLMLCFFSLSRISQQMTYFERYQNAWDIMVTLKNTAIDAMEETDLLRNLSGVQDSVVYQKAEAKCLVTEDALSQEMRALNSLENNSDSCTPVQDGVWLVNAPLVILDDDSFLTYCRQISIQPGLDGAVILNRTPDIKNPNFRNRDMVPYLKESRQTSTLRRADSKDHTVEIPVLAYTMETPILREEYGTLDNCELVHFLPLSLWKEIREEIGNAEEDTCIRILASERTSLSGLSELEHTVSRLLSQNYETETENRLQEKINNDRMYDGMMLFLGGFCVLLAIIGISSIFSHTLGFVRQRKREFARYLSIGLTPENMIKMFCVEALVIAGRPVLLTLPLFIISVGGMLRLSYLEPMIFLREAPAVPILAFLLLLFTSVSLAYYLGGRKLMKISLAEALRDDTLI